MPIVYNLEERTYVFAKSVRDLIIKIPRTIANIEDGKQVVRSSGSVAANYIEANESISRPDFLFRIKICRKEAKETLLWLRLLSISTNLTEERARLEKEAKELVLIFATILRKSGAIPSNKESV